MIDKLKSFWSDASLNRKFLMFTIFIVIFNVLFGVILTSIYTIDKLTLQATNYMYNTLSFFRQQLDENFENVKYVSQEVLYDEAIYRVLAYEADSDNINNRMLVKEQLRNYISFNKYISAIGIISSSDNTYFCDEYNLLNNYYYRTYKNFTEFAGSVLWDYDRDNVYLVRPILNASTYENIGVLIIVLNKSIIKDLCDKSNIDGQYVLAIFANDSNPVYLTNSEYDTKNFDSDFFENINRPDGLVRKHSMKEFIYFSELGSNSWKIAILGSESLILKDIYLVFFIFLLFGTIACFIIFIIIKLLSKQLLEPINLIISSINKFKKSNKLSCIPVNSKDELGTLSVMFNEMISHMDFLTQTVYKKRLIAKNLQISAIQSQINPHFIFNTLDSINWIARLNDDNDAADMITKLSNILRTSIEKTKSRVSLRYEISYIEDYIYLMDVRFGPTLKIIRRFNPETLNMEIPSLTIQPILENAIKHGIDKTSKKGFIYIHSYIEGGNLFVEVADNGAGMNKEGLEALNHVLGKSEDDIDMEKGTEKIGLINNNQRIKLLYGNAYGFTVESREGFYTKVICKLPAKVCNL